MIRNRKAAGLVWLGFVVFPIINAAANHADLARKLLTLAGASAFVAVYTCLIVFWRRSGPVVNRVAIGALGVMMAISAALTVLDRPGWGFLFIYCAACSPMVASARFAYGAVIACALLAGGVPALAGASGGAALGLGSSAAGIGLLMLLIRDLRDRNAELVEARAELATLAVAQERERFARDLHDLLGHSLSVIAIKAELAGRLASVDGERAAAEIGDVERVARQALGEVRDAVSGYRRPTLADELAGARMALTAAGIECEVERDGVTLPADVEAVLAWAVREGATNVIRHSAASRCVVRVGGSAGSAVVEVVDDGAARSNGAGGAGQGLAGLRERAAALDGSVAAGRRDGGGYGLVVRVPVREA